MAEHPDDAARLRAADGQGFACDEDASEPTSITCPRCGRTSWNLNDVREGYCGNCHDWTGADG